VVAFWQARTVLDSADVSWTAPQQTNIAIVTSAAIGEGFVGIGEKTSIQILCYG
jgi:hypothetical protein